jgi:hypothetical protein
VRKIEETNIFLFNRIPTGSFNPNHFFNRRKVPKKIKVNKKFTFENRETIKAKQALL